MSDVDEYKKYTASQLKSWLEKLGKKKSGNKSELLLRLLSIPEGDRGAYPEIPDDAVEIHTADVDNDDDGGDEAAASYTSSKTSDLDYRQMRKETELLRKELELQRKEIELLKRENKCLKTKENYERLIQQEKEKMIEKKSDEKESKEVNNEVEQSDKVKTIEQSDINTVEQCNEINTVGKGEEKDGKNESETKTIKECYENSVSVGEEDNFAQMAFDDGVPRSLRKRFFAKNKDEFEEKRNK